MNSETILKSDVLDIIFDERNKHYGAYPLRKFYPNRIKFSLFVMLGIVIVFSAFTLMPGSKKNTAVFITDPYVLASPIPPAAQPEPVKPKPKVISTKTSSQAKFISNIKIVPNKDSTETLHDLSKLAIGNSNINIKDPGEGDKKLVGEEFGTDPAPYKDPAPVTENKLPLENPDVQASYPGGVKELIKFLERNLRTPRDMEEGETIEVRVKYVVDFDGNLQSFNVVKDGGEMFNAEVLRVLKKMPKWNPGKKGGQNVPVYYTIPIKFTSLY